MTPRRTLHDPEHIGTIIDRLERKGLFDGVEPGDALEAIQPKDVEQPKRVTQGRIHFPVTPSIAPKN